MVRRVLLGVLGLVAGATAVSAGTAHDNLDFVTRASNGNLTAVAESRLALDRGVDPQLKTFARQLIEADQAAETALQSAADGSGAAVPATLDSAHQTRVSALQAKSGAAFDTAYIAEQVEVHSNLLTLYADYMLLGEDAKLKALAIHMIPITQAQFTAAQHLSQR